MLRFDRATYLLLLFKSILSERLNNSLLGLDVLLFSELINMPSILYCTFTKFTILSYTFLLTSFARYKEYMICWISYCELSDVLPAFTCARTIENLWSNCLGVNILRFKQSGTLAMRADIIRGLHVPSVDCNVDILLLKALRTIYLPSWSAFGLSFVTLFSFFPLYFLVLFFQ